MAKLTECAILVEPLAEADGGGWLASVPALPAYAGGGETRSTLCPESSLGNQQRADLLPTASASTLVTKAWSETPSWEGMIVNFSCKLRGAG